MSNTPDSPAKKPDHRMDQGGNFWTLFTPGIWKGLYAVLQPVELITEGLVLQPNRVFIIPAKRDLHVFDGEFRLKPISKPRGWPNVVTVFLRSLTRHWDGKIIAVIVSGYDGDGAPALCGIKEVGGITIAQKLETAGQPDMPESAIASGCVDFILSPEDIARKIRKIVGAKGGLTRPPAPAPTARDRPHPSG
jgi:chemotaxis response regulator CheB